MVQCRSKGGRGDWPQRLPWNRHRSGVAGQDLSRHHQQFQEAATVSITHQRIHLKFSFLVVCVLKAAFLQGLTILQISAVDMHESVVGSTMEMIEPFNKKEDHNILPTTIAIVLQEFFWHSCTRRQRRK